ncbi:ABC transporter substrate-binding protein [Paenibacillus hexagrammi]|uniref:Extracellular solute-binding protein n=1 Tax=Paenibacillus hexagrammi TaxID=2908839 RepID=A0ABY3SM67_9BACL|nr:extracellular solute-binding protein [Paenibacillus sp. YPD9-1]UJF34819.1 extracellular solute-binding protein [Paenibacillus sp. YPD9-1]
MKSRFRKLTTLTLSTVLSFSVLAGCGSSEQSAATPAETKEGTNPQAPVELTFWTMWDGGDVAVAKSIFDEYNQEHPNVKISFQQQDFNQYYTKLKTSILGGTGPDFAVSHVGGFITGMQADGNLLPLDEAAAKYKVDLQFDKYTPSVMETGKVGGKYYTVPLDNLVRVLMYNKKLLKDTSLLDSNGNLKLDKGYDAFMKALQEAKEKNNNTPPLSLTMRPPQIVLGWMTLYYQMGGKTFIDLASKKANFDEQIALKALNAYKEIYDKYVPPKIAPPADFDLFKSGKIPFYIDGAWMVSSSAQALGPDFGVAQFPQLFEQDAHVVTNHGFILPVKKNRTDAQTKAVLEFIKWWADNNWKWSQAGHLPGYEPTRDTEGFKKLEYQKFYQDTTKGAVPIPVIPNANLHQAPEVTGPIQKAMLGDLSTQEAIQQVKKNLDELLPKLAN